MYTTDASQRILVLLVFCAACASAACVPSWDEQDDFDGSLQGRYTVISYASSQQGCDQFLLPNDGAPPSTLILSRANTSTGDFLSFSSCISDQQCSTALLFRNPAPNNWHARRIETYRAGSECVAFWTDSELSPQTAQDVVGGVSIQTTQKIAVVPIAWSPTCSPQEIPVDALSFSCVIEQSIVAQNDVP